MCLGVSQALGYSGMSQSQHKQEGELVSKVPWGAAWVEPVGKQAETVLHLRVLFRPCGLYDYRERSISSGSLNPEKYREKPRGSCPSIPASETRGF